MKAAYVGLPTHGPDSSSASRPPEQPPTQIAAVSDVQLTVAGTNYSSSSLSSASASSSQKHELKQPLLAAASPALEQPRIQREIPPPPNLPPSLCTRDDYANHWERYSAGQPDGLNPGYNCLKETRKIHLLCTRSGAVFLLSVLHVCTTVGLTALRATKSEMPDCLQTALPLGRYLLVDFLMLGVPYFAKNYHKYSCCTTPSRRYEAVELCDNRVTVVSADCRDKASTALCVTAFIIGFFGLWNFGCYSYPPTSAPTLFPTLMPT